jgi:hypothetical protein
MKLAIFASFIATAAAFAPASVERSSTSLNMDRRAAFGGIAAAFMAGAPLVANAGTMDQELVKDPTEVWETGKPNADAASARVGRYTNARTQLNSNFAPQKRLTLERKSPVTRLDINAPSFDAYKKSFPGLYKKL